MVEPWDRDDDGYRHEIDPRDRVRSDDIGHVDISWQRSLDDTHLVEDNKFIVPGAGFSRNPEIHIDIEDRIPGAFSLQLDIRHFRTIFIATALLAFASIGWTIGSKFSFFGTPVTNIHVAPQSSISNPAKSDREEIKSASSSLTAQATPAPNDRIADLLIRESVRPELLVQSPETKVAPGLTITDRVETPRKPVPETKPTTIDGWSVRDVNRSTAVLEGPTGVWRVTRGDTVPGVGRINSIVRWGDRWIVATSGGLISTP
jgi:hypothetical protein